MQIRRNVTFFGACESGDIETVQALVVEKSRVGMDDGYDYGIRIAALNFHWEVVKFLTTLPDANVDACNHALGIAARKGRLDIVELLLKRPDIGLRGTATFAFQQAAEYGHLDVVKFLLRQPRVDSAANDNYALRMATKNGHAKVEKAFEEALIKQDVYQNFFLNDDKNKDVNKGLLFFKAVDCGQVPLLKEMVAVMIQQATAVTLKNAPK